MKRGRVILVGAGPGDAGLLTRRGERALGDAQVVLADRLVGPGVLALVPPGAELILVGKSSGHHPIPQEEINALLVEKAREGKVVVRLKGGDPYLFGRGAEELEAVRAAGIPVQMVPGVTAALAVPAWAGIPVTHRAHSSSVHILTGHSGRGGSPELDCKSLARLGGTLVFMMGLTALEGILAGLLQAGLDPATPAALVQNGTLPGQRRLTATAATLSALAREAGITPPAVLVVGAVCALDTGDGDALPLFGTTALVTRPRSAGSALGDALEALGCCVVPFPCIRPAAREGIALPAQLTGWIVFTSAFGVEVFFNTLRARGQDGRSLAGCRFAAIGARTAAALEARGMLADYVPEVYDAAHLARGLAERVARGEGVLLFRAANGTPELPEILRRQGIGCTDLAAYDTLRESPAAPWAREALLGGEIDFVTFTSASTVDGFADAVGEEAARCGRFTGVCIGEATARRAGERGISCAVSGTASVDGMVERILRLKREG